MFEDVSPLKPAARSLDLMSIEELEERIESLKADIAACEAMIASKKNQRAAADAIFGRKDE
ncbi:MAG: DUF1192 domain-containing protein [Hyphomonadaceae bacterium]|nr:DUF1192 domain-containing protein [Hyphomonadaceae bacterium]